MNDSSYNDLSPFSLESQLAFFNENTQFYNDRQYNKMSKKSKKEYYVNNKKSKRNEVQHESEKIRNIKIEPRTETQSEYVKSLNNPDIHLVFGIGVAGSGKTYLATKWAALSLLNNKFDKIVVTRPTVSVDEDIGFLPGTMEEKLAPWVLPVFDIFSDIFGKMRVEYMMKTGKIEIAPLAYMRGRSFTNSVILLDEAQNTTPQQLKMCLTRIGEGSKMIITGDTDQSDYGGANGLTDFLHRYKHCDGIRTINFSKRDIIRHPIIDKILDMYKE